MGRDAGNLPRIIDHAREGQEPPRVRVTSVHLSGGFAWLVLVPVFVLGVALVAFGAVAAGILGLVTAPWMAGRYLRGSSTMPDQPDASTVELGREAYRRLDIDEPG